MPRTFIFKPLQASLVENQPHITKINPYCKLIFGKHQIKGQVAKNSGPNPQWIDVIIIRVEDDLICEIQVLDQKNFTPDRILGKCFINMEKIIEKRQITNWFDIYRENH